MKPSYDVEIGKVTYNGTEIPLKSGGSSTNKFAQLVDKSITEVTADDLAGVTSIGNAVFNSCKSLTTITIPASVTSIGNIAFQACSGLRTITILGSVTIIETQAFYDCSSLTSITIPEGITRIKGSAFENCSSLTTMTILATTPPILGDIYAISTATTTIYIPKGTLNAYQTATNWGNFASKFIELDT